MALPGGRFAHLHSVSLWTFVSIAVVVLIVLLAPFIREPRNAPSKAEQAGGSRLRR